MCTRVDVTDIKYYNGSKQNTDNQGGTVRALVQNRIKERQWIG